MADDRDEIRDDLYQAALQPMSLENQVLLLTERLKVLTRKEVNLERDVRELQKAYQRGFGMFLVFPILGGFIGFIATYWNTFFKPLTK